MTNSTNKPLLSVKDLCVTFGTPDGDVTAVNKLNFELSAGETLELSVNQALGNRKLRSP